MSGGLEDANRDAWAVRAIEEKASELADVIDGETDRVFGFPSALLDVANAELKRAGYKLVRAL